jgi:DnaK suppressor protein
MDKTILKKKIKKLIKQYEEDLRGLEDMTQPVKPENSLGRISRMDAINNKGVMEVTLRNTKSKLNKLKIALNNLGDPSFGKCSSCKRDIQEGRLLFMPESSKCVRCAGR